MRIQVVLTLPRDAASIPLARHTVTAALERAGVVDDCVAEVELALSEACTNAYRHAHDADDFEVLINIDDITLTVDVLDSGVGFAGRASPRVMPRPSSDSGRGMALMAALSDRAVFDPVTGNGGSVHLVKHLRWVDDAPFHREAHAHAGRDAMARPTVPTIRPHVPQQR